MTSPFNISQVLLPSFSRTSGMTSFNSFPRRLADVNGDGRADIVGFGADGVSVSLSEQDGSFAPAKAALDYFTTNKGWWSSFDQFPRQLGDVNGDGKADIVGFGTDAVWVALAKGDGTFNAARPTLDYFTTNKGGWSSFDQYPRQVGDVNGDGKADIVGFGSNAVWIALAKGDGTFSPAKVALHGGLYTPANGWSSFERYPRQLADINGDGRMDIVGSGYGATYVSYGQTDGSFSGTHSITYNSQLDAFQSFDKHPRLVGDINGDRKAEIVAFGETDLLVGSASNSNFLENNAVYGTSGRDVFSFPGSTGQTVYGRGGNDELSAGSGNDYIDGGKGEDKLFAGIGMDGVLGGSENDTILAGLDGNDYIAAGEGDDLIKVTTKGNSVYGNGGKDRVYLEYNGREPNSARNWIEAGDGNDYLYSKADPVDDYLNGGSGHDVLTVEVGGDQQKADYLTGGSGADQFWILPNEEKTLPASQPEDIYGKYVSPVLDVIDTAVGNPVLSLGIQLVNKLVEVFAPKPADPSPAPIKGTWDQTVVIRDFSRDDVLVVPNHLRLDVDSSAHSVWINDGVRKGITINAVGNGTHPIAFLDMPIGTVVSFDSKPVGQSHRAWYIDN